MSKNGRRKLREIVWPRWLTITLIVAGLALVIFFGARSVRSLREVLYLREQGFYDGTADVSAIRSWMTIRYISLAYAVPEEYVWEQLGLPPAKDPDTTLMALNRQYNFGRPTEGGRAPIEGLVQAIILEYRQNPVATGLDRIRPWMNMQYIANSTGVPVEELFAAVNIPAEDNAFVPLDTLAREVDYAGGLRQLIETLEAITLEP